MEINNFDKLAKLVASNILEKMDVKTKSVIQGDFNLIVVPNIALGLKEYIDYLKQVETDMHHVLAVRESQSKTEEVNNLEKVNLIEYDLESSEFIDYLSVSENLIVLGLKITQLKDLAALNDSDEIIQIILTRILANKKVLILVNANNGFMNKISNIVSEIRQMGIELINIGHDETSKTKKIDLITEDYVINLKKTGVRSILIDKKQLITPLAKDKLREYKIEVRYNKEAK